jgi:hypothetical protein
LTLLYEIFKYSYKTPRVVTNYLNPVGRPRKRNEVYPYPNCGRVGFSYTNSVKKSAKNIYSYLRFSHYDRTLKDHDIDQKVRFKKPRYANEYNRKLNQATAFSFKPYLKRYDNFNCSPISDINTALPIVVYDFENIIAEQVNNELKKLNGLKVSEKEIDWLLRQKQVKRQPDIKEFYKNLSKTGHVVTFGEKAVKEGDRISSLESFTGNIIYLSDKYGMLAEILNMREKKKKLSSSCRATYNNPHRRLPHPQVKTKKFLSN